MKKFISILLIITLILPNINVFGLEKITDYATYDKSKIFKNSDKIVKEHEQKIRKYILDKQQLPEDDSNKYDVYKEDPGEGAIRVYETDPYSNGYLYEMGNKSGLLSTIADIVLKIGSYFLTTVESIIIDVATLALGITQSEIAYNNPAEATLYKSYTYLYKQGQYYQRDHWYTLVDCQQRQTYRHEFSAFGTKSGYTKTGTYDFTVVNGYAPILVEKSTHYDDHSWIAEQANYRYINDLPILYEDVD